MPWFAIQRSRTCRSSCSPRATSAMQNVSGSIGGWPRCFPRAVSIKSGFSRSCAGQPIVELPRAHRHERRGPLPPMTTSRPRRQRETVLFTIAEAIEDVLREDEQPSVERLALVAAGVQHAIVITDPMQPDNPVLYASPAFC